MTLTSKGQALWFSQGCLEIEDKSDNNSTPLQVVEPPFSFPRMATSVTATANTYVYYQSTDSVVVEGRLSSFGDVSMTSNNISVDIM